MSKTETGVNNKRAIEPNKRKPTKDNNNNNRSSSWRIWINQAATNVSHCEREREINCKERAGERQVWRESVRWSWGPTIQPESEHAGVYVCVRESALICVCVCLCMYRRRRWMSYPKDVQIKTHAAKGERKCARQYVGAEHTIHIHYVCLCVCVCVNEH